jgi:hypothetical protein
MTRRRLVVTTAPDPSAALLDQLQWDDGEDDLEVAVVAPASDMSLLEWLSDDDRVREEARRRALEAAEAESLVGRIVDVRVGDPDPRVAIEDALREFPADEVVLVTRPQDKAGWLEQLLADGELGRRLGLPVRHLVDDAADAGPGAGLDLPPSPLLFGVGVAVLSVLALAVIAFALYLIVR